MEGTEKQDISRLLRLAEEIGFSHIAPLAMDALIVRGEVRAMCASDRCGSYGRSWSCPPATGSIGTARKRIEGYNAGIIVQTTGTVSSGFDLQSIKKISDRHKAGFDTLVRQIRIICHDCMPMGAGACTRCRRCTYPDRPCRYPDRMFPSMEACGLLVSDVCRSSGLEYNYGSDTMTFTSCVMVNI